jgi:hypothetical protein
MDQTLLLRIRERAFHIWAANGGNADANWLRAETEILSNSAAQPLEPKPQKKQRAPFSRKAKKTGSAGLAIRLGKVPAAGSSLP